LKEISDEVLGFNERQITNEWYDGECADAKEVKMMLYQQMLQKKHNKTSAEIYKARRREAKYIVPCWRYLLGITDSDT
jgi:hypothetical protein